MNYLVGLEYARVNLWANVFQVNKTLLLEEHDVVGLVNAIGLELFLKELINRLEKGFSDFASEKIKVPARHEFFFEKGTIESMPCADEEFFAVKLINTHPENSYKYFLPTIIGCGALIDGKNGYPVLLLESTLLTALRTAAASAVAAKYLANKAEIFGIIGAGVQAIPQTHALSLVFRFSRVLVYDLNPKASEQFVKTASKLGLDANIAENAESLCKKANLITTVTCKKRDGIPIVFNSWIKEGMHINAVGGDSPGKFELEKSLLLRSKVVVDFYDQALVEGESQQLKKEETYGHLGEIISGSKKGRSNVQEITVFDSTGFAMEDLVTYKLIYELAQELNIGKRIDIIGRPTNSFDLYESYFLGV